MNVKRTIQLLLIDGDAKGRIQANLDNWTGIAYRIPRLALSKSEDREELKYCGIYFLFGHNDSSDNEVVYVGQVRERKTGTSLIARFSEHSRNKDKNFCNEIIFFTTRNNDFGPTELCYLENRFYDLAIKADRYEVNNSNEPSIGNVTEAKQAELDRYIENAVVLMTALGHKVFDAKSTIVESLPVQPVSYYKLYYSHKVKSIGETITAQALWTNEGVVVLKGSKVLMTNRSGLLDSVREMRERLRDLGVLSLDHGDIYILNKDQVFPSPSTAGSFVLGASVNGRTAWKDQDGKTFDQLEKEKYKTSIP